MENARRRVQELADIAGYVLSRIPRRCRGSVALSARTEERTLSALVLLWALLSESLTLFYHSYVVCSYNTPLFRNWDLFS